MDGDEMRDFTFKEKLQYWFDRKMSKGTGAMIKVLVMVKPVLHEPFVCRVFFHRQNDFIRNVRQQIRCLTLNCSGGYILFREKSQQSYEKHANGKQNRDLRDDASS